MRSSRIVYWLKIFSIVFKRAKKIVITACVKWMATPHKHSFRMYYGSELLVNDGRNAAWQCERNSKNFVSLKKIFRPTNTRFWCVTISNGVKTFFFVLDFWNGRLYWCKRHEWKTLLCRTNATLWASHLHVCLLSLNKHIAKCHWNMFKMHSYW